MVKVGQIALLRAQKESDTVIRSGDDQRNIFCRYPYRAIGTQTISQNDSFRLERGEALLINVFLQQFL